MLIEIPQVISSPYCGFEPEFKDFYVKVIALPYNTTWGDLISFDINRQLIKIKEQNDFAFLD